MHHPSANPPAPVPVPAAAVPAQSSVFLLDDHEAVRSLVRGLLDAEPDITVIGEAGTAAAALAAIPALRPDVAVLDVRLPDGDGVTVCRELRSRMPALACLLLTAHDDSEALFAAVMAGATGYVLKQIRGAGLAAAVRLAAAGQPLLDPDAAATMMARIRETRRPEPPAGPVGSEHRILELIGEGLTNRQIAERTHLAEETVKDHATALYAWLGAERRTQAADHAARPAAGAGAPQASRRPP